MQLLNKTQKAKRILDAFSAPQSENVLQLCKTIQNAQSSLVEHAAPLFTYCADRCKGMCCRNISVDAIVTLVDFVYILSANGIAFKRLQQLAAKESFFPSDCLFLSDGTGPCVFPETIKPERCIITFCADESLVAEDIKAVKSAFSRLYLYVMLHKPWLWFGF